jgi:hypothetical protein
MEHEGGKGAIYAMAASSGDPIIIFAEWALRFKTTRNSTLPLSDPKFLFKGVPTPAVMPATRRDK